MVFTLHCGDREDFQFQKIRVNTSDKAAKGARAEVLLDQQCCVACPGVFQSWKVANFGLCRNIGFERMKRTSKQSPAEFRVLALGQFVRRSILITKRELYRIALCFLEITRFQAQKLVDGCRILKRPRHRHESMSDEPARKQNGRHLLRLPRTFSGPFLSPRTG